jgi:hypothetical protein
MGEMGGGNLCCGIENHPQQVFREYSPRQAASTVLFFLCFAGRFNVINVSSSAWPENTRE